MTYPPDPLPLVREGGVQVRGGLRPRSKISLLFDEIKLTRCLKRANTPLLKPFPLSLNKERGIKGVRLINNLYLTLTIA